MAIRFNGYPTGGDGESYVNNKCYLFLVKEYLENKVSSWLKEDLYEEFGHKEVDRLIEDEIIKDQKEEKVKLAFLVIGSPAQSIIKYVTRDVHYFGELLQRLVPKCKSSRLRMYLTFLKNFNQVQTFPLPGSAVPCVAAEGPEHIEDAIDEIMQLSDGLEPEFAYKIDTLEGVSELKHLTR